MILKRALKKRPLILEFVVKNDIKKALRDTVPVLSGYIVLGMGFGILMQTKGYGIWWTLAMSTFVYAGSMQYLAVDLLCGGASLISAAITTLMVNARHLFYGISMVDRYKGTGRKKPYLIFALTDETYSLVCSGNEDKSDEERHRYYFLVSVFNQIYWVCGSVIGSLLGQVIPFSTEGIDFALTALFVTVFVEQWKSTREHVPAIVGVFASVLCLLVFGADDFLIPAMILITAALSVFKFTRKEGNAK
ncbi:MAG: AzlC family ABC transporter permease [Clostridia bacterium]|nr:AzlC family ABC transporter permease [Clostridia bacterium]